MSMFYIELKREAQMNRNILEGKIFKPGIYRCKRLPSRMDEGTTGTLNNSMPIQLAYNAERIWLEEEAENKVTYVKNRFDHNNVDMEEFTWIKIAAKDFLL